MQKGYFDYLQNPLSGRKFKILFEVVYIVLACIPFSSVNQRLVALHRLENDLWTYPYISE